MSGADVIPPYTNRGVTTGLESASIPFSERARGELSRITNKVIDVTEIKPKFDWYEGRFLESDIDKVLSKIMPFMSELHDEVIDSRVAKKGTVPKQRGYAESIQFLKDLEPVLTLSYGGQNGKYGVYFKTTGIHSVDVSEALLNSYSVTLAEIFEFRSISPIYITRVDVALDIRADAKTVFKKAVSYCKKHKLKTDCAGSWTEKDPSPDDNGRTLYVLHSKQTKLRIYEKGKQMRGQGANDAPLDWIRIEMQFNAPKGVNSKYWKSILSQLKPSVIFRSISEFTGLINHVLNTDLSHEPIKYSMKSKSKPLEGFTYWLLENFRDRLTDLFRSPTLSFKFFHYLYGDDINDYPPCLQSPAIEEYLTELEIQKFGEF